MLTRAVGICVQSLWQRLPRQDRTSEPFQTLPSTCATRLIWTFRALTIVFIDRRMPTNQSTVMGKTYIEKNSKFSFACRAMRSTCPFRVAENRFDNPQPHVQHLKRKLGSGVIEGNFLFLYLSLGNSASRKGLRYGNKSLLMFTAVLRGGFCRLAI